MGQGRRARVILGTGLLGALLLNAMMIAALMYQQPPAPELVPPIEEGAIILEVVPPEELKSHILNIRRLKAKVLGAKAPEKQSTTWQDDTPATSLAATPNITTTSPLSQANAEPEGYDGRARTSAALRRLGSCSSFAPDSDVERHCERQWDVSGGRIEAVPVDKRSEYDETVNRLNNLLATATKLRGNMSDVSGGIGKGNNFHYGCAFVGGKRRCSTY
jgi:hypothetical protein